MATNKNKKATSSKKEKVAPSNAAKDPLPPPAKPATGLFTKGQLAILILLVIGLSRVFRVKTASLQDGKQVCITHLGEDACEDSAVQKLLQYKYVTAIQTTSLAVLGMLQCWNTEAALQAFNALFLFSPLLTGAGVLFVCEQFLDSGEVWKQLMMALVLTVLAAPDSKAFLPFAASVRPNSSKTLQSLALITASFHYMYQVFQTVVGPLLLKSLPIGHVVASIVVSEKDALVSPAATPLVYFIAVDKLTSALIFAFAWYHFAESHQRVSAVNVNESSPLFHADTCFFSRILPLSQLLAFV